MIHRLSFPLPAGQAEQTPQGFFTTPWDIPAILRSLASGGWFNWAMPSDYYSFASAEARRFAMRAQLVFQEFPE